MFLFLTPLSPRGLGQRWHGEVATRIIPVARAPPHLSAAGCWQLPAGSEPVHGVSLQAGSIRGTLCRVGTRRVGRVMAQCGHSHAEGS